MSVENFLRDPVSLITALGTLVAAIASLIKAFAAFRKQNLPPLPEQKPSEPSALAILLKMPAFVVGVLLALISVGIFIARGFLPPPPQVAITSPVAAQQIEVRILPETGSGSFTVSGTSSEVFTNPNLRLYVLVHPADPFATGWWIQQSATVDRNGQWTTIAWYGAKEFPPQTENKIDLLAVVADPVQVGSRVQISDPKDIDPVAQSDIVSISIGVLK